MNHSAIMNESSIQQTIHDLAGKAKELSLKHGLRDEAQLIELEEMRLMKLLHEEDIRNGGKRNNYDQIIRPDFLNKRGNNSTTEKQKLKFDPKTG